MKKPTAARLPQASSVVCLLFRNRCAILGLLRSPPPDLHVPFNKHGCNHRSRNEVGLPTSITRSVIAAKEIRRSSLLVPAGFSLRRISGARYKSSPIQSTGGNCRIVYTSRFARMGPGPKRALVQGIRGRRGPYRSPLANFCFSASPAGRHASYPGESD